MLGLLTDLKRTNVEPIALAAGVPVRTLQEFLSQLDWDLERCSAALQRLVMDRHGGEDGIGVIDASGEKSRPTDREYWLIVVRNTATGECKFFISNAYGGANWKQMMRAAFARWHVEKWFERAKREAGLGAFEVRRYPGLLRHRLSARLAMYFMAAATRRLGGKNRGSRWNRWRKQPTGWWRRSGIGTAARMLN
ncbi:MAG: hypothetical protein AMXMBFR83_30900 [Phycisphaerae bacterium]